MDDTAKKPRLDKSDLDVASVAAKTHVLHRSKEFLVIDKPCDVRLDGDFDVTVEKIFYNLIPDVPKPLWAHQLDYATSGVLCIGLNRVAAGNACRLFMARKVRKFYLAIVKGWLRPPMPGRGIPGSYTMVEKQPPTSYTEMMKQGQYDLTMKSVAPKFKFAGSSPDSELDSISVSEMFESKSAFAGDQIEAFLNPLYGDFLESRDILPVYGLSGAINPIEDDFKMKIDNKEGKDAQTQLVPVEYGEIDGQKVTKVLLRPIHGRRHQLRLHCLHLGFPIFGDVAYGSFFNTVTGSIDTAFYEQASRMYLHAFHLALPFKSAKIRLKIGATNFMNGQPEDLIVTTKDPFLLSPMSIRHMGNERGKNNTEDIFFLENDG